MSKPTLTQSPILLAREYRTAGSAPSEPEPSHASGQRSETAKRGEEVEEEDEMGGLLECQ